VTSATSQWRPRDISAIRYRKSATSAFLPVTSRRCAKSVCRFVSCSFPNSIRTTQPSSSWDFSQTIWTRRDETPKHYIPKTNRPSCTNQYFLVVKLRISARTISNGTNHQRHFPIYTLLPKYRTSILFYSSHYTKRKLRMNSTQHSHKWGIFLPVSVTHVSGHGDTSGKSA